MDGDMTLQHTTFVIVPSIVDGRQRLEDPTGQVWEPDGNALVPVTGLQVTINGVNNQRIEWVHAGTDGLDGYAVNAWVDGVDNDWQDIGAVLIGEGIRYKDYPSTLPQGTLVRYRVASAIGEPLQLSAWAFTEATTLTSSEDTDLTMIVGSYSMRVPGNSETPKSKYLLHHAYDAYFTDPPIPIPPSGSVQRCYREDLIEGWKGSNPDTYGWEKERRDTPYNNPGLSGHGTKWPTAQGYPSNWNYGYGMPSKGSEIWFRMRSYYEPGFNWDTSQGMIEDLSNAGGTGMKWYRPNMYACTDNTYNLENLNFHMAGPQSHETVDSGYNTIRVSAGNVNADWPDHPLTQNSFWPFPGGSTVETGRWFTLEIYMSLDTLSYDDGGICVYRLWKDGLEVGEFTHLANINQGRWDTVGGYCSRLMWGQNWNGGVPRSQPMHNCDLAWAYKIPGGRDDTPYMTTDANGLKMIGPWAVDTRT
jgi:hypothetical protein